jgi:ribosomal protein L7/L12
MKQLKIDGWKPGLDKVKLTNIIRSHTGLGLAEAKRCTDDVLENKSVVFRKLDSSDAEIFLTEVRSVGGVAHVADDST